MTRILLIATVAALAITAPAHAERGEDRAGKAAERAEKAQARAEARQAEGGGERRIRAERPERQERVRIERPERIERAQRIERFERPQREQRVRMERIERPQREQRVRIERAERPQRERFVEQRSSRIERRERAAERIERRSRMIERIRPVREDGEWLVRQQRVREQREPRLERQVKSRERSIERRSRDFEPLQRLVRQDRRDERFERQEFREQAKQAKRLAKLQPRAERRLERLERFDERREQRFERQRARIGKPLTVERVERDWYDDYATQRHSSFYAAAPNSFYDYDDDDGYLYQVDRDSDVVTALFPLLGGAFSAGQPLPYGYSGYNVPYAYRSLYYDTPDYTYRYGDGAIYRVDPQSQLISAVVALLTGQSLGIGQQLPLGYDAYNVPYAYRDTYYDTHDAWYRYDDGYIYQVDPYTRMIEGMYPVSYGDYAVGYPAPAYASYGGYGAYAGYPSYSVPYGYQNLYYGAPGYNYHFANGGIYQVDPKTQLIAALVALVTGQSFGVGQMLPAGYDAYNVPYAYRDTYFDSNDAWYRYDDGYIYEVDPYTRMIETAIPVSYDGYAVGYPVPAAYPGYDVPGAYDDLYYDSPGYDYRYFDGGIYQVDPKTKLVQAVVALLTGQNLGVGQMLPTGYDAYNVPYAYRDRFNDTADSWYRYNDGYIYQVDPQTRIIQAVIDAVV